MIDFARNTSITNACNALGRSNATGLPLGKRVWVTRLPKKLNLGLTIRSRSRPKTKSKKSEESIK